jgi:hypothetical protein
MIATCDFCKKEYKTFLNWYNRTKTHTCSKECACNLKKKLSIKQCTFCNKDYYKVSHQKDSKFCSNSCKQQSSKKQITLICEHCNKTYSTNIARKNTSRFCSRGCLTKYTGFLASLRVGELHPSYKGFLESKRTNKSKLRTWASIIKKRDDNCCKKCKSTDNLQAHHIKSYKDFPELRFDINNGILLCGQCHALEHEYDLKSVKQLILYRNEKQKLDSFCE